MSPKSRSAEEIRQWIVVHLARLLELPLEQIDPQQSVARYGLDSVQLVLLVTDLEQWLGTSFKKNPLAEQDTIAALSERLAMLTRPANPADSRTA